MTDETPRGDSGPALAAVVARGTIDVPDFPKPGIVFKDLMPLFADGPAFRTVVDGIVAHHGADGFDVVAGVEARGFVVAAAVAYATGSGVVPVRKAGRLPRNALSASAPGRPRGPSWSRSPLHSAGSLWTRAGPRAPRWSWWSGPAARWPASPC